jgi:hypothetical protein
VGIHCSDHATPLSAKVGTNFADKRRSLGRIILSVIELQNLTNCSLVQVLFLSIRLNLITQAYDWYACWWWSSKLISQKSLHLSHILRFPVAPKNLLTLLER